MSTTTAATMTTAGTTTLEQRAARLNETTKSAIENTVLSPRFYTTDFDYMDKLNVDLVRREWDGLIAELKSDPNRNHFIRDERFDGDITTMEPELKREFLDFPGQFGDRGVLGLRALCRDQEADHEPRCEASYSA